MTEDLWQDYLRGVADLTRLEAERQHRYTAADAEHTRAANRFATEQGAVERQWKQLAEQAARSKAVGDELMRRYHLSAAPVEPQVTREGAGPALAEAERTITWCTQATRWVSSYEQRAREFAATAAADALPAAPAPPVPVPESKGRSGCGAGAAAMLLTLLVVPVAVVLRVLGVI